MNTTNKLSKQLYILLTLHSIHTKFVDIIKIILIFIKKVLNCLFNYPERNIKKKTRGASSSNLFNKEGAYPM